MARNEPVLQDFKTGLPTDWSRCFQFSPFRAASPPRRTSRLIHTFQTGRKILSFSMQKSAKCAKQKEKKQQEKAQLLNIPVIPDWHTTAPWREVTSGTLTNITSANDPSVALGGRYDRRQLRMIFHIPHVLHIGRIPSGIKRKHIV